MSNCNNFQKSLDWCMGTPELPGIARRVFYIDKSKIVKWPKMPALKDTAKPATVVGDFILQADAYWLFIVVNGEKSQLTSEPQGEYPNQTQLNKMTLLHPGIGQSATDAAAYLNNGDNVFIVEDMKGRLRIVGSELWPTKTTVTQDLGQGPTASVGTTITVEAPDVVISPFYEGEILDEYTYEARASKNGKYIEGGKFLMLEDFESKASAFKTENLYGSVKVIEVEESRHALSFTTGAYKDQEYLYFDFKLPAEELMDNAFAAIVFDMSFGTASDNKYKTIKVALNQKNNVIASIETKEAPQTWQTVTIPLTTYTYENSFRLYIGGMNASVANIIIDNIRLKCA